MKPAKSPENRLLSIDELDRDIVNLAARINAATYELLVLSFASSTSVPVG